MLNNAVGRLADQLPPLKVLLPLAALAGALNVLSFAPLGWWPLQILLLAALFEAVSRAPGFRRGALIGWAFGFGWYVTGVSWLFISMHRYGGLPSWLAGLAVILMALLLGAFVALGMGFAAWMRERCNLSRAVTILLVLPAALALGDWLRLWVFSGFPWIVTGYAHTDSPLAGFAPLLGVYGVGWLAAVIAASVLLARQSRKLVILPVLLLAAGAALQGVKWTQPHGAAISVRLVQGNVPQEMKFDAERMNGMMALYYELITAQPADLVAIPETAIPPTTLLPPDYLPRLSAFAQQSGSHLAIGVPVIFGQAEYANSVMALTPDGQPYRYDKHHLVPFGEFIPPGFRWFVDLMNIPLGDFQRGAYVQPAFAVRDQFVLPNICYEDLFGEQIAAQLREGGAQAGTVLLNVSNIAWFGDSIALPQHLQISRMRSLETGRPMLRATNTGVTAVIGPDGKVISQLAPYTRATLATRVQGMQGLTPYVQSGNVFVPALFFAMLAVAFFLRRRPPANPPAGH